MRTLWTVIVAAIGLSATGCNNSTPPRTVTPPPQATAPPTAPAQNAAIPAAADSSQSADTNAVESTADSTEAKTAAAPAEPLSRGKLVQKVVNSQRRAMQTMQRNQADAAYALFLESGRSAEELVERFPDLDPQEKLLCASAFYNQACALALGNETETALAALERAIAAGWDDLDQIDQDADLQSVRKLPAFDAQRVAWEQAISDKMKAEVEEELAGFESYAFDFTLPDLDAMPVKLADYQGKVVIVDIWGTWCPPCRAEIPSFVKLQSTYGEQGLQILGLNYERTKKEDDAIELIREFREAHNMNYPCLIGDSKTQQQVPAFRGYPTTLFLDRTGKVRLQFVGAHPYSRLEAVVRALLDETGT